MSGTMVNAGRAALAKGIKEQNIMLAWGTGGDWSDTPPTESVEAVGLMNEIGRRALGASMFVTPDEHGTVIIPTGSEDTEGNPIYDRYAVSEVPTRHLFIRFMHDFPDGVGNTIRELGVFVGTKIKSSTPPGRFYYTPGDIEDPGILYLLENRPAFTRIPTEANTFDYVLSL